MDDMLTLYLVMLVVVFGYEIVTKVPVILSAHLSFGEA